MEKRRKSIHRKALHRSRILREGRVGHIFRAAGGAAIGQKAAAIGVYRRTSTHPLCGKRCCRITSGHLPCTFHFLVSEVLFYEENGNVVIISKLITTETILRSREGLPPLNKYLNILQRGENVRGFVETYARTLQLALP